MIHVVVNDEDGTFTELDSEDVVWVRDCYTEPRRVALECANCGRFIQDTDFFTCLDTGDAAHVWCVATPDRIAPDVRWFS